MGNENADRRAAARVKREFLLKLESMESSPGERFEVVTGTGRAWRKV